jgi:hypothetical protein
MKKQDTLVVCGSQDGKTVNYDPSGYGKDIGGIMHYPHHVNLDVAQMVVLIPDYIKFTSDRALVRAVLSALRKNHFPLEQL